MNIKKTINLLLFVLLLINPVSVSNQLKADALDKTFLWIGKDGLDNERYFTEEDVNEITNFTKSKSLPTYLIFSGFHAAYENFPKIVQNAIEIKKKDPKIKICHYFSAHLAHDLMKDLFTSWGFNENWLLRPNLTPSDSQLPIFEVIPYSLTSTIPNIDISITEYQKWLYSIINNLNQHFDCYVFDNVFSYTRNDYIGSLLRASMLRPYLDENKLQKLEAAKEIIFNQLKSTFPHIEFFFNGVAKAKWAGSQVGYVNERNLQHLAHTDGALYEKFCAMQPSKKVGTEPIWTANVKGESIDELYAITKANPEHKFFWQLNYTNPANLAVANFVSNACFGQYLLINSNNNFFGAGRYRHREFFKFINDYLKIPLTGEPISEPEFNSNGLHSRYYEKGLVIANTKSSERTFQLVADKKFVKTSSLNNSESLSVVTNTLIIPPYSSYFLSNYQQNIKFKLTDTIVGDCPISELSVDALDKDDSGLSLILKNFSDQILKFKTVPNNWNQSDITHAYRYDNINGNSRYGLALGTQVAGSIRYPVYITKGIIRLREFVDNKLYRDCKYEKN